MQSSDQSNIIHDIYDMSQNNQSTPQDAINNHSLCNNLCNNLEMDDEDNIEVEIKDEIVEIHAYDWTIRDKNIDDDHVAIHCWGLDQNSVPHLLRFTTFPAFCYVELPKIVRAREYTWRSSSVSEFMRLLNKFLRNDAPYDYDFVKAKKTYYYRGERVSPMIRLRFHNLQAMSHCSKLLNNPLKTDEWGFIKCNVWEDSVSIVRKLLTVRKVRYSQWFSVTAKRVEPDLRISTLEHEYIAQWDTMYPIPPDRCKAWSTKPGVLAFDIECYSNNHRAMPDKYNSRHVAYMISCIYQRYQTPSTRRRYGIIIGDCKHIPSDKLTNCEIIKVDSEYDMIIAFGKIVNDTDPEIVTGYNILGFDYPYLDHRIKRRLNEWPCMGRISGERSYMTSKSWSSGAYGHQSINILQMEGRISIDLLPIIKRDYKLDKYDLNTVCRKFINKTKHDISAPEMFLIYEDFVVAQENLKRLNQETELNPSLKLDSTHLLAINQAEDTLEHAKEETTKVMEYCIQDSELVIELMENINVWVGLIEMSNIVGTTIVEIFTRGQQVRCMSQLYNLAAELGYVLDSRDSPGFKFAGGFVHEPIPGLYDNIICLDFASLYPSIIMAYNICYTTLVPPELEDSVPDIDCNIIEFDQEETINEPVINNSEDCELDNDNEEEVFQELTEDNKKEKIVKKHYRFKFYKGKEGLLPQLVRKLVAERRLVQKQMAQIKDELKILEKKEDILLILADYFNGSLTVNTVKEAEVKVKNVTNENEAAELITAAKHELVIAQLFSVESTNKRLNDAIEVKPPTPPTPECLIELIRYELRIAKFYESDDKESLSMILDELKETSEERIKQIASYKIQLVVMDRRQLALKVSANSFFGFLGVQNGGLMPLIEAAMSITAKGRELIGEVREYIEKKYQGVQIYGDTDSVMMMLPHIKDGKECNYWGKRLAQEISGIKPGDKDCDDVLWPEGRQGLFPPPLAMEFEKAMRLLCLKKKKYAAFLIGKDGNFKTEDILDKLGNVIGSRLSMLKKGIILARRDNNAFLRKTYTSILDVIMNKGDLYTALSLLIDSIQKLSDGKIPYEDLVSIRELGSNYKSDSFFMKVFSDDLKKAGKIVNPGDRLDFVIVEDPTAVLLGHKMRLTEQYLESLNSDKPEKIDYNYYIEKVLMNPINQLFEVGFKSEISQLNYISYKPTNRHKAIHLDRPMQVILKLRERGYNMTEFKELVRRGTEKLKLDKLSTPIPKQLTLKIICDPSQASNFKPMEISKSDDTIPKLDEISIKSQSMIKLNIISDRPPPQLPSQNLIKLNIMPQQNAPKINMVPAAPKTPPVSPSLVIPKISARSPVTVKSQPPQLCIPRLTAPKITTPKIITPKIILNIQART